MTIRLQLRSSVSPVSVSILQNDTILGRAKYHSKENHFTFKLKLIDDPIVDKIKEIVEEKKLAVQEVTILDTLPAERLQDRIGKYGSRINGHPCWVTLETNQDCSDKKTILIRTECVREAEYAYNKALRGKLGDFEVKELYA